MACERALWHPFWYELDQSLEVGLVNNFDFFRVAPGYLTKEALPVFYFGNWRDKDLYFSARKRIIAIRHGKLGSIQKIDTKGLNYTFTMTDGSELLVEAEETPGLVYGHTEPITDWRIFV